MPVVPGGDLTLLRSTPHLSRMFMVVQQPERWDADSSLFDTTDFLWYGTVRVAPVADPVYELDVTADAACPNNPVLMDRMTVFISSAAYGHWDRAVTALHGDQTVAGLGVNETLRLAVSSDLGGVQVGDHVVVLDEFRFQLRYPKITESAGTLTWYKDYGIFRDSIGVGAGNLALTWTQLGANAAQRREACQPPVPIMGPPAVVFIDPAVGNVNVDFDWTDSYAANATATVNAWSSWGETDHVGGMWNDNVQNPAAKNYTVLSGLRGFRTVLEILTDETDPIVEFRRGVRYVFTLRRPWELQTGDPSDAAPITDFEVGAVEGSFSSGGWRTTVRIFGSQASEYYILPGAMVILFTDDAYGSTSGSIGPDSITLADRANIVMVGWIADGSISEDSETGDVTFDVVSASELMSAREGYPVPIENNDGGTEWYMAPDLTIDRAAHHYLCWHTNLRLIADCYQSADAREIKAQDFLAGDAYATVDGFLWDRIFARLLCDRFGRFKFDIDQQMGAAGAAATLLTMAAGDWIGELSIEEVVEEPTNTTDLGGLVYNAGLVMPLLAHAPGEMASYEGTPEQSMSLALTGQPQLNTLAGRLLAYRNNRFPRFTIPWAGNWRVFDIWPQEYVQSSQPTQRHIFSADLFIIREISLEHDPTAGAMFTTAVMEMETDGADGVTIDVPEEIPEPPPPPNPPDPPVTPPTPGSPAPNDDGRRMFSCNLGVFCTDDISQENPHWYAVNDGIVTSLQCWKIIRDPWHWWTSGGTERTLWGLFQHNYGGVFTTTPRYLYKHENFPHGTWALSLDAATLGLPGDAHYLSDIAGTIEVEDRLYVAASAHTGGLDGCDGFLVRSNDGGGIWASISQFSPAQTVGYSVWPHTPFKVDTAKHSAAATVYVYQSYVNPWVEHVLRKSLNAGAGPWTSHGPNIGFSNHDIFAKMSIPYHSATWTDSDIIIATTNHDAAPTSIQRTIDGGVTWDDINTFAVANEMPVGLASFTGNREIFVVLVDGRFPWNTSRVMYTDDGGASWTQIISWAATQISPGTLVSYNADGSLDNVLVHNRTTGQILLTTPWGVADKTGDLWAVAPTINYVTCFERDTMGAA